MSEIKREHNIRHWVADRLYGVGSFLMLWGLAGLSGLLPTWLSPSALWEIGIGATLWGIGLLVEQRPRQNAPSSPTAIESTFEASMSEALQYRESAQMQLQEEAADFPVLRPQEALFPSSKPIEFTFDDLARLPSLVQRAIEDRLDVAVVPLLDPATAPTQRGDRYRLRLDGPRYDVRTLRSVS